MLAQKACELDDRELQSFAGQVLAIMGPLPPKSLAFTDHLDTKPPKTKQTSLKSTTAFENCTVGILEQMATYLLDEDESTIECAQNALRTVRSF